MPGAFGVERIVFDKHADQGAATPPPTVSPPQENAPAKVSSLPTVIKEIARLMDQAERIAAAKPTTDQK